MSAHTAIAIGLAAYAGVMLAMSAFWMTRVKKAANYLVLSDRYFFVTCRLLGMRRPLSDQELGCLARAIHVRGKKYGFFAHRLGVHA